MVFNYKTYRTWIEAGQFFMRLQATAHGTPMRPSQRLQPDPLQAFQHPACHFFMEPRRGQRRRALPAADGDRIKGGRALGGGHGRAAGLTGAIHDTDLEREPCEYIGTVFTRLLGPAVFLPRLPGFASQCAVCRSWPARQVCPPCVARFAPPQRRCERCALALPDGLALRPRAGPDLCTTCVRQPPPLDQALAAVPYGYPWSNLIARYKFGEQHGWAAFFAALLLKTPGVPQAFAGLNAHDWVIALPLSAERLQTRGFNQAWELASALARQSQTPARSDARLLLRVKHTRPQSQLKREARLTNVQGAFQLDPLRVAEVAGRRVVLVDDVMTSGASLFTAAQALRDAGAVHITGVVLARTE